MTFKAWDIGEVGDAGPHHWTGATAGTFGKNKLTTVIRVSIETQQI